MAAGAKIRGITIEIGADTTKFKQELQGINSSLSGTKSALSDTNRLLKFNPSSTELIKQKQGYLKEAIAQTNEKLEAERNALKELEKSEGGKKQSEAQQALRRDIEANEQQLKKLKGEYESVASVAGVKMQAVGDKLKGVGDKMSAVGAKLTTTVTLPLAAVGTAAIKTTADFDTSMSKVKAISGATGDEFNQLRDKAREMGSKTKFSASEAADGMTYMAMAGWKTEDMLDGLEGIMNLAAASGEDLATTSDIVTDALTAFGLEADDAGHFADVLAAASSNANTNVSMMGETFKYAAPVAGALGFSVEDTAEAIGLMANAGIKASQAGTSLRTILTKLSGEVKIAGSELGEVTIQTTNADGSMRDLSDILGDCREAFSHLSESEKANAAESIAGKNAMSGFLALMNAGPEDVDKLSGAIGNCKDSAKNMAEEMNNNLSGQLQILKSQIEEVLIQLGDALMPTIKKVVEKIQDWVQKFSDLDEGTKEMIVKVGLVVAAIGPLLLAGGKIITGVGSILFVVGKLFTVIAAHPLAALAIAIGAVVAGFIAWYSWVKKQAEAEYGLSEENKKLISTIDDEKKAFDDLKTKREESISASEGELKHLQGLIDEYNNHVDSNGKVQKGYEDRANFILNTLAQAFGMERDELDKLIDKNGKLGEEIDKVMEKKRQEAVLQAYEESYHEAVRKKIEGEKQYYAALQTRNEAQEKLQKAMSEYAEVQERVNNGDFLAYFQLAQLSENVKVANEAYEESSKAVTDARSTYQDYMSTIKNYEGYQAAVWAKDVEGIEEWQLRLKRDFKDTETANIETLRNQEQELDKMIRQMEIDVKNGTPGVTQAQIDELKRMRDLAHEEYTKAQSEALQGGKDTGQKYAIGVASNEVIEENKKSGKFVAKSTLSAYSMEATGAKPLGKSTGEDLASGTSSAAESNKAAGAAAGSAAMSGFAAATTGAYSEGAGAGADLASGVQSRQGQANAAGTQSGQAAVRGMESGASGARSAGSGITDNFASGIQNNSYRAENSARNLGVKAANQLNGVSTYNSGVNFGIGFENGISSRFSSAINTAWNFGISVANALNRSMGIASPSKVTRETGVFFGKGLKLGIEDMIDPVSKAAESMAQAASGSLADGMSDAFSFGAVDTGIIAGGASFSGDNITQTTNTTNMGGITINVNAAPGQDANEIAEIVQRRLAHETARRQAVFG